MITFFPLRRITASAAKQISRLMSQLAGSSRRVPSKVIQEIVRDQNVVLTVVRDGEKIVGMGTLVFLRVPGGFHARIEDVVVDEAYRGQGIGRKIMERLIALARKKKAEYVELTSRPSRIAANKLYQSIGFKRKKTNVYRMDL